MILNVIIEMLAILVTSIFGILPNLPKIPETLDTILSIFQEYVAFASSFLVKILGLDFLQIVIPIIILLVNFNWIYHLAIWIIRKLPIGVQ